MPDDIIEEDLYQELRNAIRSDDFDTVSKLVLNKPDLVHVSTILGSAIHLACNKGLLRIVKFLVKSGADFNLVVKIGGSPLNEAASQGHLDVSLYLLSLGVSLQAHQPEWNPLFNAITNGHSHLIQPLLDAGADPHLVYRSTSGKLKNALSYALDRKQSAIAEMLIAQGCRLPVEGVDIPIWEPEEFRKKLPPPPTLATLRDQLIAYMADRFSPVDPLALQEIVPVHGDVRISVHVIRPTETHPFLTLFTTGMSDQPMTVPAGQEGYQYAELVIHLPSKWPHPQDSPKKDSVQWPVEWLRKIAYYPHLNGTWLGGATTIIASDDPPAPLGPNTKLSCLLLLADYPNLIPITLDDGKIVHLYTVVPIYTEERYYELKHGIVALIERLQMLGIFTVVSLKRPNVVKDLKG